MTPLFTNRPRTNDITLNFFYWHSNGVKAAQLACPFFTNSQPLKILKDAGCANIQLLVRLCEATSPEALAESKAFGGVDIRFFTSDSFHAKFYILGHRALVGSANLTGGGLVANRELSIVIEADDELFDEIPALFDELWNAASVLTTDVFERFKVWRHANARAMLPPIDGIESASPPTVNVGTQGVSRARTYLEAFRSFYVETLIPAHRLVEQVYAERGERHSNFINLSPGYELDRFLHWARSFTTDKDLDKHPFRSGDDLRANIRLHVDRWFDTPDADLRVDPARLSRIAQLQALFADRDLLESVDMDQLADMLQGCAAFVEMLRFTKGGLENHIRAFKADNPIKNARNSFGHLVFGSGDYVQRIYDCIYSPEFKLAHWGRNCTLELFGWINRDRVPPFNGRTMKALRYLGFNVKA